MRRRFKFILILLFTATLTLFFETRIEALAPQLKIFIESKIEDAFNKNIKLSIGSLDGGIFYPLTLVDCRVTDNSGNRLFPILEIDRITSNYRLIDAVLKKRRYPRSLRGSLFSNSPVMDVKFATRNRELSGFARIEGDSSNAKIKGSAILFEDLKIDFSGQIQRRDFEFDLKLANDSLLSVKGTLSEDGELRAFVRVNHLKVFGADVVCDTFLREKFKIGSSDTKMAGVEGEMEARNLILNYRPFMDLRASFKIQDNMLEISDLNLGDDVKMRGRVMLKRPYIADMAILADNANLTRLLSAMNVQDATSFISGTMNGRFYLKGPIKNLKLSASLEMRKGRLGDVDFDFLNANLKGEGPNIRLEDSRIMRPSGYFGLAGEMDMRKIGQNNFFEDIKMVTDDSAVMWDAREAVKKDGVEELLMKKALSEQVNLGFKTSIAGLKIDESLRERDMVELEYKVHPTDSLKMQVGDDKEFFGFEHKDKF